MTDPHNCPFADIDYSFLDTNSPNLFNCDNNLLSLGSPPLHFERGMSDNFEMEIEENFRDLPPGNPEISYIESPYSQTFLIHSESESSPEVFPIKKPSGKFRIIIEIDDDLLLKYKKPNVDEETISIATKDTFESMTTFCIEGTFEDVPLEMQAECKTALSTFMEKRPCEEKNYIGKVMPYLLSTLREAYNTQQQPVFNKVIFESILKELIYGKEAMIGQDQKMIKNLVCHEIDKLNSYRPLEIGNLGKDPFNKRKDKKIVKGNINQSAVNHMNENYVSNVFKFAKTTYPNDKEVQKLTGQRGVSATNFRNSMTAQLNDDIFVRKAKVRIVATGQEFVNNIEYWMQYGYFENCKDKEKYIQYKQKAICNLALDRQY